MLSFTFSPSLTLSFSYSTRLFAILGLLCPADEEEEEEDGCGFIQRTDEGSFRGKRARCGQNSSWIEMCLEVCRKYAW